MIGGRRRRDSDLMRTMHEEYANWPCSVCGQVGEAIQLHHVVFRSRGGGDERSNLVGLCRECHDAVHRHDLEVYRNQDGGFSWARRRPEWARGVCTVPPVAGSEAEGADRMPLPKTPRSPEPPERARGVCTVPPETVEVGGPGEQGYSPLSANGASADDLSLRSAPTVRASAPHDRGSGMLPARREAPPTAPGGAAALAPGELVSRIRELCQDASRRQVAASVLLLHAYERGDHDAMGVSWSEYVAGHVGLEKGLASKMLLAARTFRERLVELPADQAAELTVTRAYEAARLVRDRGVGVDEALAKATTQPVHYLVAEREGREPSERRRCPTCNGWYTPDERGAA